MNFRALLAIALLTMSSLAFSETRLPHIVILATGEISWQTVNYFFWER